MDIFILMLTQLIWMRQYGVEADHQHRHLPPPPEKVNWEVGLKEATYQTLVRENLADVGVRDHIYESPIDGYQNVASPFGDVAVVARGQLYGTAGGFHFVQDPYQNDCDDCHNSAVRCERGQCEPHPPDTWHNLIALWTVKRIRHRDSHVGHRYELRYTISPVGPASNTGEFVTRNGRFDYTVPGHVFVIKLKSNGATSDLHSDRTYYKYLKSYRSRHKPPAAWTHQHYYPTTHPHNAIIPNTHTDNVPITSPPAFFLGITPNGYKHFIPEFVNDKTYVEDTTKPPIKHYHHHFYIPEVSDIDTYGKQTLKPILPTVVTSTQNLIVPTTNQPHQHQHTYLSESTAPGQQLTTNQGYVYQTTYPDTTIYSDVKYNQQTQPTFPETTVFKLFTTTMRTHATPINPSPFYVQYSEPDPTYSNNEPPTVPSYVSHTTAPTIPTFVNMYNEPPTTDTTSTSISNTIGTTSTKSVKYPDSINVQLPAPEKGTDTTIPYVSSTAITIITAPTTTTEPSTTHVETTLDNKDYEDNIETNSSTLQAYTTEPASISHQEFTSMSENRATTPTTKELITSKKPLKTTPIYSENLDIFGGDKPPTTSQTPKTTKLMPLTTKLNAFDEIFADFKPTVSSTEEVSPSTTPHNVVSSLKSARLSKYLKYKRNKANRLAALTPKRIHDDKPKEQEPKNDNTSNESNGIETKTSQSFITSISFKVNKNKKTSSTTNTPLLTVSLQKQVAAREDLQNPTTTEQVFDNAAQTLVNHARVATYFKEKGTTPMNYKQE